jgi:hypothetical protein
MQTHTDTHLNSVIRVPPLCQGREAFQHGVSRRQAGCSAIAGVRINAEARHDSIAGHMKYLAAGSICGARQHLKKFFE